MIRCEICRGFRSEKIAHCPCEELCARCGATRFEHLSVEQVAFGIGDPIGAVCPPYVFKGTGRVKDPA